VTTRRGRVLFDGQLAGWIEEVEGGVSYRYDEHWLERSDAQPISLTLPLRSEPYVGKSVHPFFLGLLPEGWLLDLALSKLKLSKDDPFGLILMLCRDCSGAVSVEPDPRKDT
jgi:serine/threonine-protein kinase HipA